MGLQTSRPWAFLVPSSSFCAVHTFLDYCIWWRDTGIMIHECVLPKLIFFGANVAGKAVPVGLLLLHLRVKINNRLVFDVRLARVVLLSSNQNVYISENSEYIFDNKPKIWWYILTPFQNIFFPSPYFVYIHLNDNKYRHAWKIHSNFSPSKFKKYNMVIQTLQTNRTGNKHICLPTTGLLT